MALVFLAGALFMWVGTRPELRLSTKLAVQRPRDGPVSSLAVAADIDLFAACAESGLSVAHSAATVAELTSPELKNAWAAISSLLAIGVDAQTAWAPAEGVPGLEEVARIARVSERHGSALAAGCQRVAEGLRADSRDKAVAAAERAGVLIAMPLSLCFLPAFIILGLAPIVINLATTMLNN